MTPVGKPDKKKSQMTEAEKIDYREWLRFVKSNSRL